MTNYSLALLKPGQCARVVALRCGDPARLDRLAAFGLAPGSVVSVEQSHPALVLRVGETVIAIDREVGEEVVVEGA